MTVLDLWTYEFSPSAHIIPGDKVLGSKTTLSLVLRQSLGGVLENYHMVFDLPPMEKWFCPLPSSPGGCILLVTNGIG